MRTRRGAPQTPVSSSPLNRRQTRPAHPPWGEDRAGICGVPPSTRVRRRRVRTSRAVSAQQRARRSARLPRETPRRQLWTKGDSWGVSSGTAPPSLSSWHLPFLLFLYWLAAICLVSCCYYRLGLQKIQLLFPTPKKGSKPTLLVITFCSHAARSRHSRDRALHRSNPPDDLTEKQAHLPR